MTDERRLSLLLVAQLAPPSTLVAARRVAGLTKYLARLGVDVTVLTSAISGRADLEGAHVVVRTRDLLATPLNWRRRHFDALGGVVAASYSRPSRLERVVVPDLALVSWTPFALARALELARSHSFSCVLTTSPPPSAHLVGLALHRRGTPWIAELRDGWTFEPPHPAWPLAFQRGVDRALERSVLRGADLVVGVTAPIVEDARRRLGVRAELITNGFDPEEIPDAAASGLRDPARHSLVHTGRMAIARSTPAPLLEAVRRLRASAPDLAARLEVVFAGPLSSEEAALLAAPDLAGTVRVVGSLDRPRALALQRDASSLLVVTEGSGRRSVATGKLFEYLAAERPILVLGDDTEAARIVEETRAGLATSATDPDRIADALRRLVADEIPFAPDAAARDRYAYPAVAARVAALVAEVASADSSVGARSTS